MYGYCGYIEHHFDLLVIGEKNAWLEYRLLNPLRDIVYKAFDDERLPEDISCLFLNKL